jgi:MFS-type transporter involved in bile tolerance (Atg22 family)
MAILVYGILQASVWGWVYPKDSPVEPLGFSLAPFVVALGAGILVAFRAWQIRREREARDPLVHLRLFDIIPVRSGLMTLLLQNLILMGVFFIIPLYLQIVQGLNAFETGVRMLPISVTLVIAALLGSRLSNRIAPRAIVRIGLLILIAACVFLIGTIEPDLDTASFALGSALLGLGMGFVASQLGNVLQSAVENEDRSEAGALQNTAQQLGSSLGTAFIGAIVITALGLAFLSNVGDDSRISDEVEEQAGIAVGGGITFISADQLRTAATEEGISESEVNALVEDYEDAQLQALKVGLLVAAALGLLALPLSGGLPAVRLGGEVVITDSGGKDPREAPQPA